MQTQHISDIYPNVISITKIRKDIDALMDLLDKYSEVKVLRGQDVVFRVIRPETKADRRSKISEAIAFMDEMKKKYKRKKGELSASQWVIRERDRLRTKEYYAQHNR